jgi:TRAP-type C4-dicarboxylate transport system permease small subunit
MNEKVESIQKFVDRILDIFSVILFLGVFLIVLLQIFMRFFLNSPLIWSEEFARYLFMWVSLIGWIFATRSGAHIRISIIADNLSPSVRKVLDIVNFILTVVFSAILFYYGFIMLQKNIDVPTITLFFTYAVVYAAVPFSSILIIFYSVIRLIKGSSDAGGTLA